MSTLEQTLKAEIARIARREVKRAIAPLQGAMRKQRQQIVAMKRAMLARAAQGHTTGLGVPRVTDEEMKKARFSGRLVQKLRRRLGLSRKQLAQLAGVSQFSVIGWERGDFRPRGANRQALIALRKISARVAKKMLAEKKSILHD